VKFLLVRHGETEWNKLGRFQGHQDIALNELGQAQARETAQALAALKPTALYSSPLYRTMQVAEEISRAVGLPVIKEEGFKELRLGDLEGVTGQEMQERWPEVYAAWRNKPATVVMPNGESLAQLQERAWGALLKLEKSQEESGILVVVSHNFAIRCVVAKLLGMPLSNFHRMSLSLSSICTFESNKANRRLVCYNSTCHLSPESR